MHMAIYRYGNTNGYLHMAICGTWLYIDMAMHMAMYIWLYMYTHGYKPFWLKGFWLKGFWLKSSAQPRRAPL